MRRWLGLALLLLPTLAALLLWQVADGVTVHPALLDDPTQLTGFDAPEAGRNGTIRWSVASEATLRLPLRAMPGVLTIRGVVAPGASVWIDVGATRVPLPPGSFPPQVRRYAVLLPPVVDAIGWGELRIIANPLAEIEGRRLGLGLLDVQIVPLPVGLRLPPPLATLVLGGMPLLLALTLHLLGLRWQVASGGAAALGLAAAAVWAVRPEAVAPFLYDVQAFLDPLTLRWWLAAQAAGLAGLPVTLLLMRRLPLAGYPLAKIVGLLLVTLGSWTIATTGLAPFRQPLIVAVWLLALVGGWGVWAWIGRGVDRPDLAYLWRGVAGWELVFVAGFWAGALLRWHGAVGPALTGAEKPMELALLNAVLRYERFPPLDPWFAGFTVNYYYLGYVMVGTVALVTATEAAFAFNLGFALIVALTVVGVAYLTTALAALTSAARRRGSTAAAMLAVLLVLVAGNQTAAVQLLVGSPLARALDAGQLVEALGQRLAGADLLHLSRPTPPSWDGPAFDTIYPSAPGPFDWFRPSRSVYDDVALPDGRVERRYAITEFPAFTLYLGDLHPHVLAMPLNLLALTLALALIAGGPTVGLCVLLGLVVGALYSLNAWDAPTFAFVGVGALVLSRRRLSDAGKCGTPVQAASPLSAARDPARRLAGTVRCAIQRAWRLSRIAQRARVRSDVRAGAWRQYGGPLLAHLFVMAVAAALATLPFLLTFSPPGVLGADEAVANRSITGRLAATFGWSANRTQLHSFLGMFGLFLLPILALAVHQIPLGAARRALLALLLATLGFGILIGFPLLSLLPLASLLTLAAWRVSERPAEAAALWTGAAGAAALFVPEVVYIRDHLEGEMSRMITIFKFYYQVWLIWGIVAAYAIWRILWIGPRRAGDLGWVLPAAVLLAGALVYPLGLRWAEPWRPGERSFDGLAFLARESPDQWAAARWLAANVAPEERLLTGFCNCDYELVSRPGAISGVQTLLGWLDGHERVWRSGRPDHLAEMARRERDIPAIYLADAFADALALLHHYQIAYVYFGPVERRLYGEESERRFAANLRLVFSSDTVRIYQVRHKLE